MINKKGQLSGMPVVILTLTVSIILLVMGLVIIQGIRNSNTIDQSASSTYSDETLTTVTEAGEDLVCATNPAATCSLSSVLNTTGGETIGSGNYTLTGCSLAASGATGGYNNTNWNVTYTCRYGGEVFLATNTSLTGFDDFADFIPIIVIAIAAGLVVAIVLGSFAFGGRNR